MPVISIDAPVGGLNAFDSVDSMPPTDAIVLDNWIPRAGFCQSRPGCIEFSDDLGGPVETLVGFKGNNDRQLIAGVNGSLLNITAGGAGVSLGTGYSNDRWQTIMINDVLIFCNAEDPEMAYDGTSLTALSYSGSSPAITAGEFIGVTSFKGRAYYWKGGSAASATFWYAQAGSYQGQLEPFDLSNVVQLGGVISSMFTWTVDSGTGPDDMLVISFDTGEVMIYQGDDPDNFGFFEQVGRFDMPKPLSVRGHMKYGSDVILMTRAGYVNLSTVLNGAVTASDYPEFSRKIARLVLAAGEEYQEYYGHECILADEGLLIFNVPTSATQSFQYVAVSTNKSWCRFTNWNAATFVNYVGDVYFGGFDGFVYKVQGVSDNGDPIELNALPAYNYLDDPGVQKRLLAGQVLSTFPEPKLIGLTGYADFVIPLLANTQTAPAYSGEGALWDTELWDTEYWYSAGGVTAATTKGWQNVATSGYAITMAVQMQVQSQAVTWRQTGLRYGIEGAN